MIRSSSLAHQELADPLATSNDSEAFDWSVVDFLSSAARSPVLKRRHGWSLSVCFKLSWPLVIACCVFVYLYTANERTLDAISTDTLYSNAQETHKVSRRLCCAAVASAHASPVFKLLTCIFRVRDHGVVFSVAVLFP